MTGSWSDTPLLRSGSFTIADIGDEALHFNADVQCARMGSADNKFVFGLIIPNVPASGIAAGYDFFVKVIDGGSPGTKDTYKHVGAVGMGDLTTCQPGADWYGPYPITAGNLTVFA